MLLDFLRRPSPLKLAITELEEALRNRLTAVSQREYYSAMEDMLTLRINRLREDIVALSEAGDPPNEKAAKRS